MRVFDFSNQTEEKVNPECTYTTFRSNEGDLYTRASNFCSR